MESPAQTVEYGTLNIKHDGPLSLLDDVKDYLRGLVKKGSGRKKEDALHNPSSPEELRKVLETGTVDPNSPNYEDNAPIHSLIKWKAKKKKEKSVRMELLVTLLTFGDTPVDIEKEDGDGNTALHLAVMLGDHRLIKVLIAFGANTNALNSANQTPLDQLKGPQRVFTQCLRDIRWPVYAEQKEVTPGRVSSPIAIPHVKRPCGNDSPSVNWLINTEEKGAKRRHLPKQRSMSLTSSPNMAELLTLRSSCQVPPLTSIASTLEKGTGIETLSNRRVSKLTGVLQEAGAERRQKLFRNTFALNRNSRITFDKLSESVSESEAKSSSGPQTGNCHKLMNARLKYYTLLHTLIKRCVNVADQSPHILNATSNLAVHMREAKLLQMAGSRILFLDGGGLRGFLQIEILSQIERNTGRKITELFDWIVGTSTGGIIALGLVYAKKTLAEVRQFYFRAREDVFKNQRGGLTFDTDALEDMLKKEFGTTMKMSDVKYPRVVIAATYKEKINLKLHLFNNCFEDELSDYLVWKVARYTSAGPVFFTEKDNYVDGGILAQNPSSVGLTAIQKYYQDRGLKLPISLVVSIGSGQNPNEDVGNVDATEYLYFGSHWFNIVGQLTDRIKSLTTLLSTALTESEIVSENCRFRCEEQGIEYFRFNPKQSKVIAAGEVDLPTLIDMILTARRLTIESNHFQRLLLRFLAICACTKTMPESCFGKMKELETLLKA